MQLKYLVGLCFVAATYALPAVECDTCHGGGGGSSGGSGGGSGGSGGGSGGPGGGSGGSGGQPGSKCNTGPVQCCNQLKSAKDVMAAGGEPAGLLSGVLGTVLGGVLGTVLGPVSAVANVGLTCNPINVIGIGGNSCNAQTVCCENNSFKGIVAIGCTPINLSL